MRVAIVTTRHSARDDRVYYKEARSLALRYGHVFLIAPWDNDENPWRDKEVTLVTLPRRAGLLGRLLAVRDAVREIRQLEPQVCHFHDFDLLFAVPLLRLVSDAKLIYDVHEFYPESIVQERLNGRHLGAVTCRALRAIEGWLARRCDLIVCAVEPLSERFRGRGPAVVTVFNYPRLDLINGACGTAPCLIGDPSGKRGIILYQGTITHDRGLLVMIEAMAHLRHLNPRPLLSMVGHVAQDQRAEAEALVRSLGLEDDVRFVDPIDHMAVFSLIQGSEVGIIPFLSVGQYPWALPIKLFEYMACGLPVVAADLPASAPYIEESKAGLLFKPGDSVALAAAIEQLLLDRKMGWEMGERGRLAVQQRWNWAPMEQCLLDAYADLEPDADLNHGLPVIAATHPGQSDALAQRGSLQMPIRNSVR